MAVARSPMSWLRWRSMARERANSSTTRCVRGCCKGTENIRGEAPRAQGILEPSSGWLRMLPCRVKEADEMAFLLQDYRLLCEFTKELLHIGRQRANV